MRVKKEILGFILLIVFGLLSIILILMMPPVRQNIDYHDFSDNSAFFCIPNFLNVVSNIPFLMVGIIGLLKLQLFKKDRVQYLVFFIGIILTSIGSGYYHLNPNNQTLVMDRFPMTLVFMSLMAIIVSEFINAKIGKILLFPFLLIGLTSIIYWVLFNDLRLYILVQFYPIIAIIVILLFFKSFYNNAFGYWLLLIAYAIAKFFEHFDNQTFKFLSIISGHSLKHIISGVGLSLLLYVYVKRNKVVL